MIWSLLVSIVAGARGTRRPRNSWFLAGEGLPLAPNLLFSVYESTNINLLGGYRQYGFFSEEMW